MVVADLTDELWDRALDCDFEPTREGDQALKAVLQFHGLVRNGGMDYALDTDFDKAAQAAEGLRRFGATELAEAVSRAREIVSRVGSTTDDVDILDLSEDEGAELRRLNDRYGELLPTDGALEEIVRRYVETDPDAFEPL